MGHGLGPRQRAILSYVAERKEPTTFEAMRWDLWLAQASNAQDKRLSNGWNTSLMRALKPLTEPQNCKLRIDKRHLHSPDEVKVQFPNKTFDVELRRQRQELLPSLFDWVDSKGGPGRRYEIADNENYMIEQMYPETRAGLRTEWSTTLLPSLEGLLCSISERDSRNLMFRFIAKGKGLFEDPEIQLRASFLKLLQSCTERDLIPQDLLAKLDSFARKFLPADDAGLLCVKGYVHRIVDVPRLGSCRLKDRSVDFLESAHPNIVKSLAGYLPPTPRDSSLFKPARAKHSEVLDRLIDQTIFQEFHFLHMAA